jgi:hypothetical protein
MRNELAAHTLNRQRGGQVDGMFLCEQKILVIIKYTNRQLGPMQRGLCLRRVISVLYYTHSYECVNSL